MSAAAMRPKIAFFDFASCEGCQLAILNAEDELLDLLALVDLVEFREALSEKSHRYDVAFVEGSIHREEDAERLRAIRDRARILVALGACANTGNVQARTNRMAPARAYHLVYGSRARDEAQVDPEHWPLWAHTRVRPLHEVVPVDFTLRGCPVDVGEFLRLVKALVAGAVPQAPRQPVCVECKAAENECVVHRGETCLGPVTWRGCGAVCVTGGYRCDGCRGLLPDANLDAHRAILGERGLDAAAVDARYALFTSHAQQQLTRKRRRR